MESWGVKGVGLRTSRRVWHPDPSSTISEHIALFKGTRKVLVYRPACVGKAKGARSVSHGQDPLPRNASVDKITEET